MKKTVSVHIKGINFLLEEDAYQLLSNYLEKLTTSLKNQEGAKEIADDIELRIAELCSNLLGYNKQVIELSDIEEIIKTLGDPNQFIDSETADTSDSTETEYTDSSKRTEESYSYHDDRRLFRDTENAKIAGVCSGLANYFQMDVLLVRIIFLIVLFFLGFGFPLYIILWIVVPKPNSTIDRLRMKGSPINVETVREEVENAAHRFTASSKRFSDRIRKTANGDFVNATSIFLRRAIGIFLICIGFGLLICFLVFVVGGFEFIPIDNVNGFISSKEMSELVFAQPFDQTLAWIGAIVAGTFIVLQFITAGITYLFLINNKWTKYVQGLFTMCYSIGIILCIYVGIRTGRDFAIQGEIERNIGVVAGNQLMIETEQKTEKIGEYKVKSSTNFGLIGVYGNTIINDGIKIKYKKSDDSVFHVYQIVSSQGRNHFQAISKVKNVKNSISLAGNVLKLNSKFTYPKSDKLRVQQVEIVIEIPKNGRVMINNKSIELGEEIDEKEDDQYEFQEGVLRSGDGYEHYEN
jgi:phage shock protein PspC (stress-responsive transcriptional regulator)